MKNQNFNQAISIKIYPQKHVRGDGRNTIYLRVIIDRRKKEFNLKVYWPSEFFDPEKQSAKKGTLTIPI